MYKAYWRWLAWEWEWLKMEYVGSEKKVKNWGD